jgi:hypothetical protein
MSKAWPGRTLAKSIHDAAWGAFLEILQAVAVKRGLHILAVNPKRKPVLSVSTVASEVRERSQRPSA